MACVCLTIVLNETIIMLRRGIKARDLAFVLTCAGAACFDLACAFQYNVDSPERSILWLRLEVGLISLTALAFFWFMARETGLIKRRFLVVVGVWAAFGVASQVLDPGELSWIARLPLVTHVALPFGLDFVYMEVESGPIVNALYLGGTAMFCYLFWVVSRFSAGHRQQARRLYWVLGIMFLANMNDFAVDIGLYRFLYTTEYAWLALVVLISNKRSIEIIEAAMSRRALKESQRALVESESRFRSLTEQAAVAICLSRDGRFLYGNPKFLESFGLAREEDLLGRPLSDFVAPARRAESMEKASRRRLGFPMPPEHETLAMRRDGTEFPIHIAMSRGFQQDGPVDISFIVDISDRRRAEDQLRRSLDEKETLLRELYHRTKNNMNVINSLLSLQSAQTDDPRLREAFEQTENRISAMALVHDRLYAARDLSHINLREYATDLVGQLMASFRITLGQVLVESRMEDALVTIDAAIPCGLILNELISNAFKHAFPSGRKGRLGIELERAADGSIRLSVSDDGIGPPRGFDPRRDSRLGLQTIFALAEGQLGGQMSFAAEGGFTCTISFKDGAYGSRLETKD